MALRRLIREVLEERRERITLRRLRRQRDEFLELTKGLTPEQVLEKYPPPEKIMSDRRYKYG